MKITDALLAAIAFLVLAGLVSLDRIHDDLKQLHADNVQATTKAVEVPK